MHVCACTYVHASSPLGGISSECSLSCVWVKDVESGLYQKREHNYDTCIGIHISLWDSKHESHYSSKKYGVSLFVIKSMCNCNGRYVNTVNPFAPDKCHFKRDGLSQGVVLKYIHVKLLIVDSEAFPEGLASHQGGLSKGVCLYGNINIKTLIPLELAY